MRFKYVNHQDELVMLLCNANAIMCHSVLDNDERYLYWKEEVKRCFDTIAKEENKDE